MVQEKYGVQLTLEERERLRQLIRSGQHSARVITRVRILLRTDDGWSASQVAAALGHLAAHGVAHQTALR